MTVRAKANIHFEMNQSGSDHRLPVPYENAFGQKRSGCVMEGRFRYQVVEDKGLALDCQLHPIKCRYHPSWHR